MEPVDPIERRAASGPSGRFAAGTRRLTTAMRSGARVTARATANGSQRTGQAFRSFARRDGAGESGLARFIEMHTVQVGADAALTVSLAGTIFALPTDQARSAVALFLLLTMAPFVLLAPFVGPVLDRFRHGRRWAIGTTLAVRGFFCWVLAGAIVTDSPWVFPLALVCLVASRAYAVARASAIPRLLPAKMDLVTANSRIMITGLVGMGLGGALAAGVSRFGVEWSLRLAFATYIFATVLAIRLPAQVDTPVTDATPRIRPPLRSRPEERLRNLPNRVLHAIIIVCGARFLVAFLTLFLIFLTRENPLPGLSTAVVIGAAVAAAGVGNVLGSLLGNKRVAPPPTPTLVTLGIIGTVSTITAALFYALWSVLLVSFVGGVLTQLGKLCLDSIVQTEVPESRHSRVFAWIETTLQLAWVAGGAIAIVLPLEPRIGFGVAAAVMVLGFLIAVRTRVHGIRLQPAGTPPRLTEEPGVASDHRLGD
ncbi:MAG TPA: MFS transporter [Intrasporangiaceae bacterium]|nr:MFS transporter [Intrasporangiaceae bacterium]